MSQPSASGAPPAASEPARSDTPRVEPPSFSQPHAEVHVDGGRSDSEVELQARLSGSARGSDGASKGLWGAFAVLALLLAAVALSFVFLRRSPEVEVAVVAGAQGDTLQVHVPQAASGTKVRYAGVEVPAEAGRAVFPLAADALKVGDNKVSIEIVEPGEDVSTTELELHVDYRVRMDVSGLARPTPEVAVIVDAIRGTKVSVAGAPVELDESGSARVPFEVGDTTGARFDLEVPYHVAPPKVPAVDGKLELHLPVASMQIDRPGEEVFTDSAQLEIGGAVEPGAKVEVDGAPVPVSDGRFLHQQALGKSGEYTFSVVARVDGKAPRARTVKVTRVEDMAIAAAAFEYDDDLSYARIAQNPTIYRGQRAGFDGRVYHVEVQGGRSVLQMLVRDCPRGHKCQLWVDYAQATEATVGSLVRVLGVVSGEQQYRSKKGGVQTAPAVSARFILPLVK